MEVLTVLLIVTLPLPSWRKAPLELMVPAAVLVNVPIFVMVIGPLFVVVQLAPRTKLVPVRVIPLMSLVFRSPLKVVVPLPAD